MSLISGLLWLILLLSEIKANEFPPPAATPPSLICSIAPPPSITPVTHDENTNNISHHVQNTINEIKSKADRSETKEIHTEKIVQLLGRIKLLQRIMFVNLVMHLHLLGFPPNKHQYHFKK